MLLRSRHHLTTSASLRRFAGIGAVAGLVLTLAALTPARNAAGGIPPGGDVVADWNRVATDALTPAQGTNPMAQSRTLAILHAAIHDALNAVEPRFASYTPGVLSAPHASARAAVAAAARDVLIALVPDAAGQVDAAYAAAIASLEDGPAARAGVAIGQAAARATLSRRRGDHADRAAHRPYAPRPGAGEYQFTPRFDFAAQPGWGEVTPFVINLQEHGLDGPMPLASAEYAQELQEVMEIGARGSTRRTPEASTIAQFWYEDSPLGWNRIANDAVRHRRLDAWAAARTLALVNFAMADGFIAGFEAKYRFRFWRPETAIRAAADDGNPRTRPDPRWEPFLVTPPVPDYPSTHTVLGWAAAEVLAELLGDEARFRADSLTLPGVTREYGRFSAAAEENGRSRIYAGIHFPHAVKDGRRQGRSIGRAVARALPAR